MSSVCWAGPQKISKDMETGLIPIEGTVSKGPVRILLGFASDLFSYGIDLGYPQPGMTPFDTDPLVKNEWIWQGRNPETKALLVHRKNDLLRIRKYGKKWDNKELPLQSVGSILTEYSDPVNAPEIYLLKEMMAGWRFYDSIRTDKESSARRPQVGTYSPVLSADGSNLASAVHTIQMIGDREGFARSIEMAFPGTEVVASGQQNGMVTFVRQPGMLRQLSAAELSDGTLRYILLSTALFSPRPPKLMVLNEPETSLHPDLIPSLATLIADYSRRNQIVVITHSQQLRRIVEQQTNASVFELYKNLGRTQIACSETSEDSYPLYGWTWPKR